MSLFDPPIPASIIPQRKIGNFNATVTIEELSSDGLAITQHPVQQGASITDHAYMLPAVVKIHIGFDESTGPLVEIYEKFRTLQSGRVPFDIITGKRQYKNMLIAALNQVTDVESELVLFLEVDAQEVFIVSLEAVSVPERSKQANPGKTGYTQNAGNKKIQLQGPEKINNNSSSKSGISNAQEISKNTEPKRSILLDTFGGSGYLQ